MMDELSEVSCRPHTHTYMTYVPTLLSHTHDNGDSNGGDVI